MRKFSRPKRLVIAATTALFVAGVAPDAMAFCFSNDSLSNGSFTARQMDRNQFFQSMLKVADSACNKLGARAAVGEIKDCKKMTSNMADSFKLLGNQIYDNKYSGGAIRVAEDAAAELYHFTTGLPVVGDTMDFTVAVAGTAISGIKDGAKWVGNEFDKLTSKRFRKSVGPDGTQCCSWKNRDCNPSGKKDGKIYFTVKYAGVSRVVRLGATDHMECRIDKNNPKNSGCKNYVWPQSPPRPNEKTKRGLLIKSFNGDKCLEVGGGNRKNGANVNMWECHGGKNQRWVVYRNGTIRSEMNWKCLDIAVGNYNNIKNGSNVVLHDCHGKPNQRWTHWERTNELVNRVPGGDKMCLDVKSWNTNNGANVHVWKCGKKQANQRWTVGKTATYTRVLKVRYPGKCLDNTGGSKKGGQVHSWDCNVKNVNQQWAFKVRADNYLEIKSRRSGMCLDVAAAKKDNGAGVIQWPCNGKAHQQWKIHGVKDGWFQLRARHSGKCLDLKGPYQENGTPFQQWDCKDVKNQSFRDAG